MLDMALSFRAFTVLSMHDISRHPLYEALVITSNAVPVQVSFSSLEFCTMPTRERYLYSFPGCDWRRACSSRHGFQGLAFLTLYTICISPHTSHSTSLLRLLMLV